MVRNMGYKTLMVSAILGLSLGSAALIAEDGESMSEADVAMYAEMGDANPAEVYVMEGESYLEEKVGGTEGLADFLGVSEDDLGAELATFPKYVKKIGMVVAIDQMLQAAMAANGNEPYKLTSSEMNGMAAFVKSLANGEKITLDLKESHNKEYYELGKEIFHVRRGGRGLSCYNCHSETTIGSRLRMQILPNLGAPQTKAAATWPAYRMTKSELTALQKRFQGCMNNSLQAKLPQGAKEMVALELYVTSLAEGETVQIPGLKR